MALGDASNTGFCYGQEKLAQRCAERPLTGGEIHAPNDYYGHASVLKRYAGLPDWYAIKGVLEHGVVLSDRMWDADRDAPLPVAFSPSAWRAEVVQRLSGKPAHPIGFGFLYAMRLVENAIPFPAQNAKGTLAFPCHSTHTIQARYDCAEYAEMLANLPAEQQPVTVCLYWKNFEHQEQRFYKECGLPVVTAGHMFDRDFMLRLYDLLRRFRYATSNVVGTHILQAVAAGCRFFYAGHQNVDWSVPQAEQVNTDAGSPAFQWRERESWRLFQSPVTEITAEQRAFVDELIGTQHVLAPAALRSLLLSQEWSDKFAAAGLSPFAQRRLAKLSRMQHSIRKRLPWNRRRAA